MTEPKRLVNESGDELGRTLLRSGRVPASRAARQRAIVAATAVVAASGVAAGSAAAATGTAVAKSGSLLALKWLGVAGAVGLGVVTTAAVVHQRRSARIEAGHVVDPIITNAPHAPSPARGASQITPAAATPPGSVSPAPSSPIVVATGPLAPPTVDGPSAVRVAGPLTPPPPVVRAAPSRLDPAVAEASALPAEMATLDQARGALAGGNAPRALAILDAYAGRFPHGSMAPEATVLRIEALSASGDRASARRVADAFLAFNPQSPYAVRIRSIAGAPPPGDAR